MNAVLQNPTKPHLTLIETRHHYDTMSDAQLVIACQTKDKAAFESLVKRHQKTVYTLLYRLAPEWHDTSDMSQEAFIRIWRSIQTLRNPHAFRSWLNQLVTNLFYDELRKRPKNALVSMDEPIKSGDSDETVTRDIVDLSSMPDELSQRRELSEAINYAIEKLPEQFKTVIVLRELEGLSYDEIAEATQSEIGTVKSRIARARSKVQEMLEDYVAV
jgi:RNA polymerase sigma-70 factor (ECF subfamily)